jgi:ankyrin repeat protein
MTELMCAAVHGATPAVCDMIGSGTDVNETDNAGWTALMWAANYGRTCCVEALLAAGAHVNVRNDSDDSALTYAIRLEDATIIHQLTQAGADVNSTRRGGFPLIVEAANAGKLASVLALAQAGADVNCGDHRGRSILMTVLSFDPPVWVVQRLIDYGANVNASDITGVTPVMLAARKRPDLLKVLLHAGADGSMVDRNGKPAMTLTSEGRLTDMITILLAAAVTPVPTPKLAPSTRFRAR